MSKIKVLLALLLLFSLPLIIQGETKDFLFLHNDDQIVLQPKDPSHEFIPFQCYSISSTSKIKLDKGAGVAEETITIKNSEGWKSYEYPLSLLTIIVKEAGNSSSDSDIVIRIDDSKVKVVSLKSEDSAKKGSTCSICKKKLTW